VRAFVVAGLAFGDEGKGAVTDWLVRQHRSPLVVRYNGGPQAAHNVVDPSGRHHTFAQFGAGTLAGARTYLSHHMLVDPRALWVESQFLSALVNDPMSRISMSPHCTVITPYHVLANQQRERLRGDARHGSVGRGVGEARRDSLRGFQVTLGDLRDRDITIAKLEQIRKDKESELGLANLPHPYRVWEMYRSLGIAQWRLESFLDAVYLTTENRPPEGPDTLVFEGAQGVLLDETFGFAPYNSWTDCTFNNAHRLLASIGVEDDDITDVGVVRSYYTRHGAGPFPTEGWQPTSHEEQHNGTHEWMGEFRVGAFDLPLLDYAIRAASPSTLVVTHRDVAPIPTICTEYITEAGDTSSYIHMAATSRWMSRVSPVLVVPEIPFLDWLEQHTELPIMAAFYGPNANCAKIRERTVAA
jgi:adenylosuccinate synthase